MSDGVAGTLALCASVLIVGSTALGFNRAGRKHTQLGPWSIVLAWLAYLTGLTLALYGIALILAPLGGAMPAARTFFYHAFMHAARLSIVVAPMVILQMPVTVLLVLRPVLTYVALLLVEALFGTSLLTALATPAALVITLLVLRVDWSRGRKRLHDMVADDELPADYYTGTVQRSVLPLDPLHHRITSAVFGQRPELSPGGPARGPNATRKDAYTVPTVSVGSFVALLGESLLLFAHAVTCDATSLHALLTGFALVHSGLVYVHLGPVSPFE